MKTFLRIPETQSYKEVETEEEKIKSWDNDLRRIDLTILDNDVRVSTVFLPIDHGYSIERPVLYETMVFGGKYSHYQERYRTEHEAIKGHKRIVEAVKNGTLSEEDEEI